MRTGRPRGTPSHARRFDAEEAIRLRREGHTYREIGAALGVSNQAVRERLVGLGVDIPFNPPRSERQ